MFCCMWNLHVNEILANICDFVRLLDYIVEEHFNVWTERPVHASMQNHVHTHTQIHIQYDVSVRSVGRVPGHSFWSVCELHQVCFEFPTILTTFIAINWIRFRINESKLLVDFQSWKEILKWEIHYENDFIDQLRTKYNGIKSTTIDYGKIEQQKHREIHFNFLWFCLLYDILADWIFFFFDVVFVRLMTNQPTMIFVYKTGNRRREIQLLTAMSFERSMSFEQRTK